MFFHVPKTSGSAVTAGLVGAPSPQRFVAAYDRTVYGKFEGFKSMAPEMKRDLYLDVRDFRPAPTLLQVTAHFRPFGRSIATPNL